MRDPEYVCAVHVYLYCICPNTANTANTAKDCVQACIGSAELLCLIADMSESHAKTCTANHYRPWSSCGRSPTIHAYLSIAICCFMSCEKNDYIIYCRSPFQIVLYSINNCRDNLASHTHEQCWLIKCSSYITIVHTYMHVYIPLPW